MEMFRSAVSKVMWVGRATIFMVGLAVVLFLTLAIVAQAADAARVPSLKKGVVNTVKSMTTLVGTLTDPILKLDNNGTGPALQLEAGANQPPLVVNADAGTATNLKAADSEKLDGKTSGDFATQAGLNSEANTRASADTTLSNQLATHNHDAAYVNEADHTKATHDALGIDADTVDGKHAADFASKAEAPGFDSQTFSGFTGLSTTTTDIVSFTLTAPADGFVILTGNGIFDSAHQNGTRTLARANLTQNSGSQNSTARTYHEVPSSAPSGLYSDPFSLTRVFFVGPGEHTFYLTADMASGSGSIGHINLTGVFVKNQL
jgi:hypothetical protein